MRRDNEENRTPEHAQEEPRLDPYGRGCHDAVAAAASRNGESFALVHTVVDYLVICTRKYGKFIVFRNYANFTAMTSTLTGQKV